MEKQLLEECEKGNLARVKQLIEQGVSPHNTVLEHDSSRTSHYSHPLFKAIRSDNSVLVRYLIETQKVDMFKATVRNVRDGRRYTTIHEYDTLCYALQNHEIDPVLLEYLVFDAQRNNMLDKPVATYYHCGTSYEGISTKIKYHRMTYLHYAAWSQNAKGCELLVGYGSDLHKRCKDKGGRWDESTDEEEEHTGPTPLEMFPAIIDILNKSSVIVEQGSKMLSSSTRVLSDLDVITVSSL